MYQTALKSGNRGHIKKATAHLTKVLTLAKMEKRAEGSLGARIGKLLPSERKPWGTSASDTFLGPGSLGAGVGKLLPAARDNSAVLQKILSLLGGTSGEALGQAASGMLATAKKAPKDAGGNAAQKQLRQTMLLAPPGRILGDAGYGPGGAEEAQRRRKAATVKAAAMYQTAFKSGNRGHIKKATAHLANVLTLAEMEKRAGLMEFLMPEYVKARALQKATGGGGRLAALFAPKITQARRLQQMTGGRKGLEGAGSIIAPETTIANRLQELLAQKGGAQPEAAPETAPAAS
jgi:hypothetical protein